MKKLIIVALGVCILGTACSRDNNLAEKNTYSSLWNNR